MLLSLERTESIPMPPRASTLVMLRSLFDKWIRLKTVELMNFLKEKRIHFGNEGSVGVLVLGLHEGETALADQVEYVKESVEKVVKAPVTTVLSCGLPPMATRPNEQQLLRIGNRLRFSYSMIHHNAEAIHSGACQSFGVSSKLHHIKHFLAL